MKSSTLSPYSAEVDSDLLNYVEGPGNGCGYYSGMLWPDLRWETREQALRCAKIANIAYREGYEKAQRDIRAALGLKGDQS